MVLVTGLTVTLFGIRVVGRPLKQLIEKTRRIGLGDLTGALRLQSRDELGELATSLNAMCEQLSASREQIHEEATARVEAVDQLRHADRLRTVGRLASGLAHELGTPLNVVAGRAGLISSGKLSDKEIVESAETIRDESHRMTGIIRQLLDFARRSTPQPTSTDLRKIAEGTLDMLTALADKSDVRLKIDCEETSFPIRLDVEQLQQVLSNLVINAIQSMPQGGIVTVGLHKETEPLPSDGAEMTAPYYCLTVADQGAGISPDILDHLFEPFFTTKQVGEGTGLGLSISYGIIKEHGGWIDVKSDEGKGSCFSVYLPMEAKACLDES
jgi:signal transduction histidine kinase